MPPRDTQPPRKHLPRLGQNRPPINHVNGSAPTNGGAPLISDPLVTRKWKLNYPRLSFHGERSALHDLLIPILLLLLFKTATFFQELTCFQSKLCLTSRKKMIVSSLTEINTYFLASKVIKCADGQKLSVISLYRILCCQNGRANGFIQW